jgi:maltose alpha-D-glucosyltransferase/alpha-amylase
VPDPIADKNINADALWYKDAVIYQMHVKAFHDANGDGIGDFAGLAQRLDYIQELGVNTIWLLPFYPSPLRDDGYDIAHYTDVHPDYGTIEDFRAFIDEAHRRGLKVITELVINHTSDQHPWFQAARRAPPGSPERDFYVWSDTDKTFAGTRIIFTDTESSNWAWDPLAGQYYWHRFFSHQPDLNHNNPAVVDAVIEVMRFWLDMGVDGMRLDAIPYLCVREGTNNENLPETHAVLKRMRAVVDANYQGRMFLAEANQWPEDVREYFGDGDECHVAYHFPLMPRIFMAVALEDRYPIAEIMRQTPDIPDNCQWAIFLRNHDELTLEMVTDKERDYMYRMYAQEPRMRVNVGIRRRLAPLLNNDVDRIKLMNSLLLSMPGSPIIYYGDEIGMGDNIYIGDRNGVRTPMQWSVDRNAGFSRADPQRLYLPLIMDPIYGYQAVNVEAQGRDPSSLLNWTRRILAVRRQQHAFGRGSLEFVRPQNRKIIAYVRAFEQEIILCVANLSQTAQAVELDLAKFKGRVPVEMMGRNAFPPIGDLPYFLTLPAHGFFWLLLSDTERPPAWHVEVLPATELPVLVMPDGLSTLLPAHAQGPDRSVGRRTQQHLEREVLPEYLRPRAWFDNSKPYLSSTRLGARLLWTTAQGSFLLSLIDVNSGETADQYILPLALAFEDEPASGALRTVEWTLAKIRAHARVGVLIDAFANPAFCLAIARGVDANARLAFEGGELRFHSTEALTVPIAPRLEHVQQLSPDNHNTMVLLGESIALRVYRRVEPGINPDAEMARFLTRQGFANVASLLGHVDLVRANSEPAMLVALYTYIGNQGSVADYAVNHLERFAASLSGETPISQHDAHSLFNAQMRTLGCRIGEMHIALSSNTDDPAFAAEKATAADLSQWYRQVSDDARHAMHSLQQHSASLPEQSRARARHLLDESSHVASRIQHLLARPLHSLRIRCHGDLSLQKLLVVANDFVVTDFEGDLSMPLATRRQKQFPLHDVADVIVSFDQVSSMAIERASGARPELRDRLQLAFQQWRTDAVDALLNGYRSAVQAFPGLSIDDQDAERMLTLYQLHRLLRNLTRETALRTAAVGPSINGPSINATVDALLKLVARN